MKKRGRLMEFSLWDILKWSWAVILPHNWYLHKRSDRLHELHAETVKRKEFDDTISSLRDKIDQSHNAMTSRFDDHRREMADRFDKLLDYLVKK